MEKKSVNDDSIKLPIILNLDWIDHINHLGTFHKSKLDNGKYLVCSENEPLFCIEAEEKDIDKKIETIYEVYRKFLEEEKTHDL